MTGVAGAEEARVNLAERTATVRGEANADACVPDLEVSAQLAVKRETAVQMYRDVLELV